MVRINSKFHGACAVPVLLATLAYAKLTGTRTRLTQLPVIGMEAIVVEQKITTSIAKSVPAWIVHTFHQAIRVLQK